jgi:tetratricopeptide (TPR) repeat protein
VRLGIVLCVVALGGSAQAGEEWVRARSPHAEVLTDGTEAQARRAAERIEAFRRVLEPALAPLSLAGDQRPPLVLAFRSRAAFASVLPHRNGAPHDVDGVILGGSDRTTIAVHLEAADFEGALAHEYVHYALGPVLSAQPPWLGEGLAELLAQASLWPEAATVGRASDSHLRLIARAGLLPLREVLAVGYLSSTYQGEGRERFYAQSWALAHWIVAGGHGGIAGIIDFTHAIAEGEDPAAAFARSFGMTVDAAQGSLAAYLAALPLPTVSIPLGPAPAPPAIEIAAVDGADVDIHLGDLLLRGGRLSDARSHFARALGAGRSGAHEGMAAVLLRLGQLKEADQHIEAALAANAGDPRALQRRAELIVREVARRGDVMGEQDTARAVAVLERALAADPDLADAADLLARLRPAPIAHRIALLRRAVKRDPARADIAFTLSALHIRRNDFAEAARVLRRARENTRDDAHRFLSSHLLSRIRAVASARGEARGVLEAVECLPAGALAFRVRTPTGVLRLAAESGRSLFLYDADGETVERELTCGPASLPVTARYVAAPERPGTHVLLSLSFEDEKRAR